MHQVIALMQRQAAVLLFDRPEAGEVDLPLAGIGREELIDKVDHILRIIPHDFLKALIRFRIIIGRPAKHIALGAIGDVLVNPQAALLARQQKFPVRLRQIEGRVIEVKDAAFFQLLAIVSRPLLRIRQLPPSLGIIVIINFDPGHSRISLSSGLISTRRGILMACSASMVKAHCEMRILESSRIFVEDELSMKLTVNGEVREDLPDSLTVRELLERYKLSPEKVAIELNRRLLRGDKYETALKDGDEVEIVTFVGGG